MDGYGAYHLLPYYLVLICSYIGGPGAFLLVWLTGIFGIATKYSVTLLSVKYRVKTKDGSMAG
jgi:Na+/alanine symporter